MCRSILLRYIFFLLLVIACCQSYAQDTSKLSGYGIEFNASAGKVLKINLNFPPLPNVSTTWDLNIIKQTTGTKAWQQRRKFPITGLGITYTDYGINDVYGKCIAIYPVYQFYLHKGRKLEWTWRFGMGVGYVTKHYERYPNWDTVNNIIGSHLNNFTMLSSDLRYHINKHWDVQIGFTGSHLSNGDIKRPNIGINLVGGHIGFRYFPVTSKPQLKKTELPELSNRILLQVRLGVGFLEYGPGDGTMYKIYMPTVLVSKRYGSRNKVFAGIDYAYYESSYRFLLNNEIDPGNERKNAQEMSIFIGNEFLVGRIGLVLQAGYPIKQAMLYEAKYVEKLGYNFYLLQRETGFLKELTIHSYIKANKLRASAFEFGAGASF